MSGDAPLIKASDVKMPDEKKYVVDDFGKNAILAGFYGVTITDALSPALSDGQNLFINDFMIKATPFALLVKNIQLSKCEVPITVKCKNEMQILMLKDYNRKYSITNDPCSNDPDNICKKTLNMCGGKIDIELIRTDKNCNFVAHINIETTSRLTNEDRKKYPLGETAVLSFWKEGSDCWKEPLKIVSGCEDDFYGAYNILIPADKYNKEGVTAPIPPAPTSPCDGLDESACKAKSECYWSVIGNGECLECSSNAMPLGCNHLARSDCTVNGKCGVSNCEWDQIMFDNTGIGCWTRIA